MIKAYLFALLLRSNCDFQCRMNATQNTNCATKKTIAKNDLSDDHVTH